jgi:hypothetical protein
MRFRGGGVGHLGTLYLDSGLKKDNHESGDEQQVKVTFAAMHEDSNSYPHEEQDNGAEEVPGTRKEQQVGENTATRKTKKTGTRTQTMSTRRREHKRRARS